MRSFAVALTACAASTSPGIAPPDALARDGAVVSPDSGIATTCGNGALDPGELCDGTARACRELGGSFASGSATCRADCRGWDPSACALAAPGSFEAVKPASRDPKWAAAR